ncbi:MAG: bifunctional folylpolyglutamate synthase/dihydrofolate synthase [Leptolyngbya sp. SIO4C1]|nr:bifunctional folylpolyglutamate synthase/dihydrofolate synthase [Leptolyngbya sp. SIO4C1]
MTPAAILQRYGRFGVDLSLARIERLLASLDNPQQWVPIVHVAGTNGKGSVCAYLSAVLSAAGYRVGRYTSPHLVDWTERICLNDRSIDADQLRSHLLAVEAAIDPQAETPTQFEVFTAAAWHYFAARRVDIAVIEVGLGGRLDATNVCASPLVSVITSISREHWQRLGPTVADIAREKAGILKSGRPAAVGPLPAAAAAVVAQRAADLSCPLYWVEPAAAVRPGWLCAGLTPVEYPQALLGEHQRINSALAIAALQLLQQQGWQIAPAAIQQGMAAARWPGRLEWTTWQDQWLLIDGAHNPAAAQVLRKYVDQALPQRSITWLMGMLETKDHKDVFAALLRPGDRLCLVPVPGHLSASPVDLAQMAQAVCPELQILQRASLSAGLAAVFADPTELTVLCGSLYLVGDFLGLRSG